MTEQGAVLKVTTTGQSDLFTIVDELTPVETAFNVATHELRQYLQRVGAPKDEGGLEEDKCLAELVAKREALLKRVIELRRNFKDRPITFNIPGSMRVKKISSSRQWRRFLPNLFGSCECSEYTFRQPLYSLGKLDISQDDPNFHPGEFGIDYNYLSSQGALLYRSYLYDDEPIFSNAHLWTWHAVEIVWEIPPHFCRGRYDVSIAVVHNVDFENATSKYGEFRTGVAFVHLDRGQVVSIRDNRQGMIARKTVSGSYRRFRELSLSFELEANSDNHIVAILHEILSVAHAGYVESVGIFWTNTPIPSTGSPVPPSLNVLFTPT